MRMRTAFRFSILAFLLLISSVSAARSVDPDNDGIPTQVELSVGLDPMSNADGSEDWDNDGWSNADEYRYGTGILNNQQNPSTLPLPLLQKVFPSDGAMNDHFGHSVAIDGEFAVVGADGHDAGGENAGAAYVYKLVHEQWVEFQKLMPKNPRRFARFGFSVAIAGNRIVIGAPKYDIENDCCAYVGRAYVFELHDNRWLQIALLDPEAPGSGLYNHGENFGYDVAISGGSVFVGAPNEGAYGEIEETGAAYVFAPSSASSTSAWTLKQSIYPKYFNSFGDLEFFGIDIAVSGNRAAISGSREDHTSDLPGLEYGEYRFSAAYLMEPALEIGIEWTSPTINYSDSSPYPPYNQWFLKTIVGSPYLKDPVTSSKLAMTETDLLKGYCMDTSFATTFTDASYTEYEGTDQARFYSLSEDGSWTASTLVTKQAPWVDIDFGCSVTLYKGSALIGSPGYPPYVLQGNFAKVGAVFSYLKATDGSWYPSTIIKPADGVHNDQFGASLSVSGSYAIVGSPNQDDLGKDAGVAYLFNINFNQ